MTFEVVVISILIIGFFGLYLAVRQLLSRDTQVKELESVVQQVFGKSAHLVAQQSRDILQGEKEIISNSLTHQHRSIETMVDTIKRDLEKRQQEIRTLEQDRVRKFSELTTALESHRKLADELSISTKKLAEVLSNNQARGEWGERIIEDLMQANGLMEGVHYVRQLHLKNSTLRPDITLLLPDKRYIAVDVKFPYSEIQKLADSSSKEQQKLYLQQLSKNLQTKIDKVAEYIDPSSHTLDYAILFVPNEMIFSFLNQKLPEVIDHAFKRRVLLVSPFTFLVVARTMLESYRNFMISDSLRDAVIQVDEFVREWGRFKDQFDKYGRSLKTLQTDYEELTGTRVRQMERKIEKIETIRQGGALEAAKTQGIQEEPIQVLGKK
jgi:DNA recombination protein RmuC